MSCGQEKWRIRNTTLGIQDKATLRQLLNAARVELNPLAIQLFEDKRFVTSKKASILSTVEVSVAELGLVAGATFDAILLRAAEYGLNPCPLELAPYLRLDYLEQPEGAVDQPLTYNQAPPGSVTIASIPICTDEDFPWGFYLRKINGVLWLRGYTSWSGHVWSPEDRFVFMVTRL